MRAFILAGCRTHSLLSYSTLIFKTLRKGFPTAPVEVLINPPIRDEDASAIGNAAKEAGCDITVLNEELRHHEFVKQLIVTEDEPFWLIDTDVIFYGTVENWDMSSHYLAGALIPEFDDEFTNAITRSRLHTSLLYVDPIMVRQRIRDYERGHPQTIYNPAADLYFPLHLPMRGRTIFYDTAAMLYHAIGGTAFTQAQLDHYFHFHFGTCSEAVLPHLKDRDMIVAQREAVLNNHAFGIGKWREQLEYFQARAPLWDGRNVIEPVTDANAVTARQWCIELCKGDAAAMSFCDMWYRYCHAIDDLIDTLEDGRPLMAKEQMLSIFFTAALLYNCEFYWRNKEVLWPIVLLVTNTYRDSVAWENSSKAHLRAMADVFRTCGNEMYVMVALLCGGEAHMRAMSMAIKERDWIGQHDADGRPM